MFVLFSDEKLDGGTLYDTLRKHRLLPQALEDPRVCMGVAGTMTVGFICDNEDSHLALLLESHPEPGVVGVMMITERARLNQRRNDFIELSKALRDRWFGEYNAHRVETRIPVERTQTIRCFRHMGFKAETLPSGMRNGAIYNGKPASLCIMSLLPTDPIKELSKDKEEPTLTDGVEQ